MKFAWFKKIKSKYPLVFTVLTSLFIGAASVFAWCLVLGITGEFRSLQDLIQMFILVGILGPAAGVFIVMPVMMTLIEMKELLRVILASKRKTNFSDSKKYRLFDLTVIVLGILYNYLLLGFANSVMFESDWHVVLYNLQKHAPVYTKSWPALWLIILVGISGYCVVNFIELEKQPPLLLVLGMSAMYMGTALSIVWMIQVFKGEALPEAALLLLPICCICITARTVMEKMQEWNMKQEKTEIQNNMAEETDNIDTGVIVENIEDIKSTSLCKYRSLLRRVNEILMNADRWPMAAFLFMWPLLGILICILILFGQEPDSIIKAWTETADWNLSQRTAPQNLYMDEHYLCTVAAGGHKKIVKPIRLGVRHGHEVIVNRQLCVANAFEQILEEKTPRFHKTIRGFYDKYGFPIGKWIMKSKLAADITYFVMKPLEWVFLMVIYLVDSKPENRIAVQYTGKTLRDFYRENNVVESVSCKLGSVSNLSCR